MIIRKPYAFLIKNFRLIHLFMLLISGFLLYRVNVALQFFNDYVKTRQVIRSDTLIGETVPISIIVFSILIISMSIAIIVLFKKKDKPILLYFASVIFYIAIIVLTIITRGVMTTIMIEGIDPRVSRIFRDFWLILFVVQIIVVGFYLIRTLGFDVKKFHFGEDLVELKIEAEDNEEYELTTGFDADKLRMRSKMKLQELKSFYYENKIIIIVILFLILIVMPSSLIAHYVISNKKYSENEVVVLNNYEFKVLETYITKKSYNGNTLFRNSNSYLIVKFNVNNPTNNDVKINMNNLRLEINNKVYGANTTSYQNFTDLGTGYEGQSIINDSRDFIAVFAIKDEDLTDYVIVRYAEELYVKNNEATGKYYRILLNPKNIDKVDNVANLKIGEQLLITDLKLSIDKYNIKDYYTYEINNKTKYIVNKNGLVLSLNYTFTSNAYNNLSEYLKKYGSIRYTINSKTYNLNIENLTPSSIKDILYLAVDEDIKDADDIYLVIKLRNTECKYKLK